ncbi:alpha/beta hydrolase [Methylocapsa polymorpha]|uniref:Alpha/beta hydrolase n=1 Tax=Methylocapsa polymorpha TaxID=3080828 RepID=A0ABZ0HW08_9HYPH|nr:alpha/beta hydrolase [Methylocapsa sp. RX1]
MLNAEAAGAREETRKTFVLAHGSWHGGWCWRRVADRLRAQGHAVFAPTFTGMGERAHLLNKDIGIDTFVQDLVEVILTEELTDVVLVGHSFGGMPITGLADRIPERIAHVVYLDGLVPESGESAFSTIPRAEAEARIALAQKANGGLAVPPPDVLPAPFGLAEGTADYAWVKRRLTPHPLGAYTRPLLLGAPAGNGLPCAYIYCSSPPYPFLEPSLRRAQAGPGWTLIDLAAPHEAMITHPEDVTRILLELADSRATPR